MASTQNDNWAYTANNVTIDLNDAGFLAQLLKSYIKENNLDKPYLDSLYNHLNGNTNC